jgi:hypothetical protein
MRILLFSLFAYNIFSHVRMETLEPGFCTSRLRYNDLDVFFLDSGGLYL